MAKYANKYEKPEYKAGYEAISSCGSLEEFAELLKAKLHAQSKYGEVAARIDEIREELGLTQEEFGKRVGVSRTTVSNWVKGKYEPDRDNVLRIGLASGMDADQIDALLDLCGYSELYAKEHAGDAGKSQPAGIDDAVCIYVLAHRQEGDPVQMFDGIREDLKGRVKNILDDKAREDITTAKYEDDIAKLQDVDALRNFLEENVQYYSGAYKAVCQDVKWKLEDYEFVFKALEEQSGDFPKDLRDFTKSNGLDNVDEEGKITSGAWERVFAAIEEEAWTPTRDELIYFCIYMPFDADDVLELLEYAHFALLLPDNISDAILIYLLNHGMDYAGKNCPDYGKYWTKDEGGRVYGMAEILERLEEYFDNDSEETEKNKKIIHDTINNLKDKYRIVRDF